MSGARSQSEASLTQTACAVLGTADAAAKAAASREAAAAWAGGRIGAVGTERPPDRPARPARPELVPPRAVRRRRINSAPAGRIALYHALAHIELNAIDLAWDMVARFAGEGLPRPFLDDWVQVADDEARHFQLLSGRLAALGAAYGDLPAHDGLWQAAEATAHDVMARLAVVPMVLEARGLDVTPAMAAKLHEAGDKEGAALLGLIHREEVGHVAAGWRWFAHLCATRGLPAEETWRALVRRHFRGALKPPFDRAARAAAGMAPDLYEPLAVDNQMKG